MVQDLPIKYYNNENRNHHLQFRINVKLKLIKNIQGYKVTLIILNLILQHFQPRKMTDPYLGTSNKQLKLLLMPKRGNLHYNHKLINRLSNSNRMQTSLNYSNLENSFIKGNFKMQKISHFSLEISKLAYKLVLVLLLWLREQYIKNQLIQ
jgi:hypothetical protein